MKKYKNVLLVLLTLIMFIPNTIVNAREDEYENENLKIDEDLNITENYDSTVFFAGTDIIKTSDVNGISFILGDIIHDAGTNEYAFYLGNKINLSGTIENDLFAMGNIVNIQTGSKILRDSYILGEVIYITSNINRNINIYATEVNISNTTIKGNVNISAKNIILGSNVKIDGTLKYNENAIISGIENNDITTILTYQDNINKENFSNFIWNDFITTLIFTILIGILLVMIFPKFFNKLKEETKEYSVSKGLSDTGYGLLILVLVAIAIFILMLTVIGIPLAFIVLLSYILLIFLTIIVGAYLLGNIILEKVFNTKTNDFISIVIGVTVINLLKIVPVIGVIVSFAITCISTTFIIKALFKKEKQVIVIEEPKKAKSKSTTKKTTTTKRTTKKDL